MSAPSAAITILSSGIGLGVYIPALLIDRQLQQQGIASDVEVLEDYYTPQSQAAHIAHRDACQQDFALAQLAHRMAADISDSLEQAKIDQLLQQWAAEQRQHFIVWSGFWLPILERYRQYLPNCPLQIDHCRIDADVSASFKIYYAKNIGCADPAIWLWQGDKQQIVHEIRISDDPVIPFEQRADRLVMHGGGWGLGTYTSKIAELANTHFALDIVVANRQEISIKRPQDRFFMLDPQWLPWHKNRSGALTFPPMLQLHPALNEGPGAITALEDPANYHAFYPVIRQAKAIISKPGGCTLIDSLNAATPVILLAPYGYAEQRNAEIWQALGFGISLAQWQTSGYDPALLQNMHQKLLAQRHRSPDYVASICAKLLPTGAL